MVTEHDLWTEDTSDVRVIRLDLLNFRSLGTRDQVILMRSLPSKPFNSTVLTFLQYQDIR